MKVKFVKTGEIADFDESYATRLIEQGKAVRVKEGPLKEEPFMPVPEPAEEQQPEEAKPKSGSGRKGK